MREIEPVGADGLRRHAVSPLDLDDLDAGDIGPADDGRTSVSYVPPGALAARHELTDALAARLGGAQAVASAVLDA